MNNKTIIWSVVGVVVVAGLAWWLVGRSGMLGGGANSGNQNAAQVGSGSPNSMASLLASGISQKCTLSNKNADGTQTNGTVYVTSGHLRGDFTVQNVAGQATVTSHMITDGVTTWIWTDQMPAEGMKMSYASMNNVSSAPGAPQQGQPQSVNPGEQANYSCSAWSVDQSEFTLPTNVIPQGAIEAASDRVMTVVSDLQTIAGKLQTRITAAQTAGHNMDTSVTALADMNAKITDADTQATAAVSETASLQPDNGVASIQTSNTAALKGARAEIQAAQKDLVTARADAGTIVKALIALGPSANVSSTVTVTASGTVSTSTP